MATHIHRVTVRGRFTGLSDDDRAALRSVAADHEALTARFTPDGTIVYDARTLDFFSVRVEVRDRTDDGGEIDPADVTARAHEAGLRRAEALLSGLGVAGRDHRITSTDMATVWD